MTRRPAWATLFLLGFGIRLYWASYVLYPWRVSRPRRWAQGTAMLEDLYRARAAMTLDWLFAAWLWLAWGLVGAALLFIIWQTWRIPHR